MSEDKESFLFSIPTSVVDKVYPQSNSNKMCTEKPLEDPTKKDKMPQEKTETKKLETSFLPEIKESSFIQTDPGYRSGTAVFEDILTSTKESVPTHGSSNSPEIASVTEEKGISNPSQPDQKMHGPIMSGSGAQPGEPTPIVHASQENEKAPELTEEKIEHKSTNKAVKLPTKAVANESSLGALAPQEPAAMSAEAIPEKKKRKVIRPQKDEKRTRSLRKRSSVDSALLSPRYPLETANENLVQESMGGNRVNEENLMEPLRDEIIDRSASSTPDIPEIETMFEVSGEEILQANQMFNENTEITESSKIGQSVPEKNLGQANANPSMKAKNKILRIGRVSSKNAGTVKSEKKSSGALKNTIRISIKHSTKENKTSETSPYISQEPYPVSEEEPIKKDDQMDNAPKKGLKISFRISGNRVQKNNLNKPTLEPSVSTSINKPLQIDQVPQDKKEDKPAKKIIMKLSLKKSNTPTKSGPLQPESTEAINQPPTPIKTEKAPRKKPKNADTIPASAIKVQKVTKRNLRKRTPPAPKLDEITEPIKKRGQKKTRLLDSETETESETDCDFILDNTGRLGCLPLSKRIKLDVFKIGKDVEDRKYLAAALTNLNTRGDIIATLIKNGNSEWSEVRKSRAKTREEKEN